MYYGQPVGTFDRRLRPEVEHHGEIVDPAHLGQQFRMARVVVSGKVQSLFVQWHRGHGIHLPVQSQPSRRHHRIESRLPRAGVDHPGHGLQGRVGPACDTRHHLGRRFGLVGRCHFENLNVHASKRGGTPQDLGMPDHDWPAAIMQIRLIPRAGNNLRPNPRRVTHGQRNQRFRSLHHPEVLAL